MINRNNLFHKNYDQPLKSENMTVYAIELAKYHNWLGVNKKGQSLIPLFKEYASIVKDAYVEINEYFYSTKDVIPSAEWYLDNFYIISDLTDELGQDLLQFDSRLNYLASGESTGLPRIYALIVEFIKAGGDDFSFDKLRTFITEYQKESPLSSTEIWSIPIMIKLIMLERIYLQVKRILYIQEQRKEAEEWINRVLGQGEEQILNKTQISTTNESHYSSVFIERVTKRLKEYGSEAKLLLNWLDHVAEKQNLTVGKVISTEYHFLTFNGVLMGNTLSTLKIVNAENWAAFFEGVSLVQKNLESDPANIFSKMDFYSRDRYRHEIERFARKFNVSELMVAHTILDLAGIRDTSPYNHVGYYLVGEGRNELERELTRDLGRLKHSLFRLAKAYRRKPLYSYFGTIASITFFLMLLFSGPRWYGYEISTLLRSIALFSGLVLTLGIAVNISNKIYTQFTSTSFLPKLDLGEGIPKEYKTIVVMPVIFDSPQKVKEQLRQMEAHYLANQDDNLFFAILGDFADANQEDMPGDNLIIQAGLKGVQRLNKKHGKEKFFYYHRERKWNSKEKRWMGWERKRGKLLEFNRLLLNKGETSFIADYCPHSENFQGIQYVITLDADTILPRDAAKKLVGTIAHPMQRANLDPVTNRLLSGYGIIQPRIGITALSGYKSRFSSIFVGNAGIDPYSFSISDVYQDLFQEGIFTGKGIYDLAVFHSITETIFPENTILSHDLIEGLYVRTGLATDIQLYDNYPTQYLTYVRRLQRWIRGDWQIIRYLFAKELHFVSKWKIIDNLRRSVEAPSQFILLLISSVFPSFQPITLWIYLFIFLSLSSPLLLNIADSVLSRSITKRILARELRLGIIQIVFSIGTLPYLTYVQINAITKSVYRQVISKKLLLEWETAADAEQKWDCTLKTYYRQMFPGVILALPFLIGLGLFEAILVKLFIAVLVGLFCLAPLFAFRMSLPYTEETNQISDDDRVQLNKWARQIWGFFDVFVNHENHYLPPDNVQLEPYKGVAARTSPTNIGLAMLANLVAEDLGFISKHTLIMKVNKTLQTIEQLPKWHGHIYNWYKTNTLEPLYPIYISTVDNGNFATYLIALKNGLQEIPSKPPVQGTILQGLDSTLRLIDTSSRESSLLNDFRNSLSVLVDNQITSLVDIYQFIDEWSSKLQRMAEPVSKPVETNNRQEDPHAWTASLVYMLQDYKRAFHYYYPYIANGFSDTLGDVSFYSLRKLIRLYVDLLKSKKANTNDLKGLVYKALKNAVITTLRVGRLVCKIEKLAYGMDFRLLYDFNKRLFSIGYNLSEQKLDQSYYDLLASEARQTSLFAIAKGDIPETHWFQLSRPLTRIEGHRSLVAWSGTMFEFLMPLIILKNYKGTLMDETYHSVIKIQQAYAKKKNILWGTSESGFFSFDIQSNYQYKAFGVPGLGLKRGLAKDLVISPYSTFMALPIDFKRSMSNLTKMKENGFMGIYGPYEAIDYTKSRVPYSQQYSIVKSYMVHHQGMSFVSLGNILTGYNNQKRFHREPRIRCIELLLQEQTPLKDYTFNPRIEELSPYKLPEIITRKKENPTIYRDPETLLPLTKLLSNREYSVMMTLSGSGYSQYNDIAVTRWRNDSVQDIYGYYLYVQNLNSGEVWSATFKPYKDRGEDYRVTCFPNSIKYYRQDGNIVTQYEVFVAAEDPVEIRKVTITNESKYTRDIQLTSYSEPILEQWRAEIAHPIFSKLFIQTRYENGTLVAFRRPRQEDKRKIYMMHTCFTQGLTIGEFEYETDRTKFIGRGRTLNNPKAMEFNQPLSNSVGAVLDPILSLRCTIRVPAGKTTEVYFISGVEESKASVIQLANKYKSSFVINQAKELSWSQSLMELDNLDLSFDEANLITSLSSNLIYSNPTRTTKEILKNKLGQSGLWPLGISGDLPVVLLKIQESNQSILVEQLLKIQEYWKIKGLFVDIVILNEDSSSYYHNSQLVIQEKVEFSQVRKMVNKPGGIFTLIKDQLESDTLKLILTVARIVFSGENGSLYHQIRKIVRFMERTPNLEPTKKVEWKLNAIEKNYDTDQTDIVTLTEGLLFYNGYGGFSQDGKEYVICLKGDQHTPLPWVNVIANKMFGTIISESGSSTTWSQNSREYKISPWFNDPLLDPSGEAILIKDKSSERSWSPMPKPMKDEMPYLIRHGQGYSIFEHTSNGIEQKTTIYVPLDKTMKIIRINLLNKTKDNKNISLYYYIEWVLGVQRENSAPFLISEEEEGFLLSRNIFQEEFKGRVAYLTLVGADISSFTTDRDAFIGVNRTLNNPLGIDKDRLPGSVGNRMGSCAAIQADLQLEPGNEKIVYVIIGDEPDHNALKSVKNLLKNEAWLVDSYQQVVDFWDKLLTTVAVKTPVKSFDLLFNRWLIYQTLTSRIWTRGAYYQSGGAFGFRDQLQDVMALTVVDPEITRNQILLHSSRQFEEGDVQHWWHPEEGKGIRTKFSDDLLWLPYVTADYIQHTNDWDILDKQTAFIQQELLGIEEDERYAIPALVDKSASVYEHCVLAIDHSLRFGEHGLPLIGTGDWNDGFSAVGREGKGESVWLGWFLIAILKRYIPISEKKNDLERAGRYRTTLKELTQNMDMHAWDGSWYRRAYYDDGTPLGSSLSTECQIDAIAQSWAVISGGGKESRAKDAMLALERYLWDRDNMLLKLFTPPFDKTEKNPGYIKGYTTGVRENGGQYTHAAIWAVLAYTHMSDGDKAFELFDMLNPINHAKTSREVQNYKLEPYVLAADVYSVYPNIGRGGWSWYTGAAGWMYQVALEGILGIVIEADKLYLKPCVPSSWKEYQVDYRYQSTLYKISVFFQPVRNQIIKDDTEFDHFPIQLVNDGAEHTINIYIKK